ncbi:unnamed protein product [Closterium sp. Naga37s-1]|nr:unnamed protein product [Closterium sp. Naga37s-1]
MCLRADLSASGSAVDSATKVRLPPGEAAALRRNLPPIPGLAESLRGGGAGGHAGEGEGDGARMAWQVRGEAGFSAEFEEMRRRRYAQRLAQEAEGAGNSQAHARGILASVQEPNEAGAAEASNREENVAIYVEAGDSGDSGHSYSIALFLSPSPVSPLSLVFPPAFPPHASLFFHPFPVPPSFPFNPSSAFPPSPVQVEFQLPLSVPPHLPHDEPATPSLAHPPSRPPTSPSPPAPLFPRDLPPAHPPHHPPRSPIPHATTEPRPLSRPQSRHTSPLRSSSPRLPPSMSLPDVPIPASLSDWAAQAAHERPVADLFIDPLPPNSSLSSPSPDSPRSPHSPRSPRSPRSSRSPRYQHARYSPPRPHSLRPLHSPHSQHSPGSSPSSPVTHRSPGFDSRSTGTEAYMQHTADLGQVPDETLPSSSSSRLSLGLHTASLSPSSSLAAVGAGGAGAVAGAVAGAGAEAAEAADAEGAAAEEQSGPLSPSCMAGPALPSFSSVMSAASGETFSQDFKRYQQQRSKSNLEAPLKSTPGLPSFSSVMSASSGETFSQDFKRYQQQRSKNKEQGWGLEAEGMGEDGDGKGDGKGDGVEGGGEREGRGVKGGGGEEGEWSEEDDLVGGVPLSLMKARGVSLPCVRAPKVRGEDEGEREGGHAKRGRYPIPRLRTLAEKLRLPPAALPWALLSLAAVVLMLLGSLWTSQQTSARHEQIVSQLLREKEALKLNFDEVITKKSHGQAELDGLRQQVAQLTEEVGKKTKEAAELAAKAQQLAADLDKAKTDTTAVDGLKKDMEEQKKKLTEEQQAAAARAAKAEEEAKKCREEAAAKEKKYVTDVREGKVAPPGAEEIADLLDLSVNLTQRVLKLEGEATAEKFQTEARIRTLLEQAVGSTAEYPEALRQDLKTTRDACVRAGYASTELKRTVADLSIYKHKQNVAAAAAAAGKTGGAAAAEGEEEPAGPLAVCRSARCKATDEELSRFMNYTEKEVCPDDWHFVQELIFDRGCHSLPRRRCFAANFTGFEDPVPFPNALWNESALMDTNVNWEHHTCKSFACLKSGPGQVNDCKDCFNLDVEKTRWKGGIRGTISMEEVFHLTNNTLRIGLDIGGGSGSFAARMQEFNCTVLTTGKNWASPKEKNSTEPTGVPYMEAVAARGLVPLYLPFSARLPFYDNTIDVIHTGTSINDVDFEEFEEMFYDWDRVLRPGGVIWFDLFYSQVRKMPLYMEIVDMFKYDQLHRAVTPSLGAAGLYVHMSFVLQKPRQRDFTLPLPEPFE